MIPGLADIIKGGLSAITDGAANVIKTFKADPTKVKEAEAAIEQLKITAELESQRISIEADKLKQAELEAQLKDMADSRNREIQIATSDKAPLINKIITPILAILILGSTFLMWYIILFKDISKDKEIMVAGIIGSLTTISMGVVGYYFGSSVGSKEKGVQMAKMATEK